MNTIDPNAAEFVIQKITDGNIFEEFAQSFISSTDGVNFQPVGGIQDCGIDGLYYFDERKIYQISIENDCRAKIRKTIKQLKNKKVNFNLLIYVTNRQCKKIDKIQEDMHNEHNILVQIRDIKWFTSNINLNQGTINVFNQFTDTYMHEYLKPGKSYEIADFINDPRLYVFIRQQWDDSDEKRENLIIDALILYALESTDPDKDIFLSPEQIKEKIAKIKGISIKRINNEIDARLKYLSEKPRKIKYHSGKGYVLPYETRRLIKEKNINDKALYEKFRKNTEEDLLLTLKIERDKIKKLFPIIEKILNKIFYEQGLEFAEFIKNPTADKFSLRKLNEIVDEIINSSLNPPINREKYKNSFVETIRKMVYDGTDEQKEFLKRLSNTYLMMFLLQIDPKLTLFFQTLASKLVIFVDTSIIIPALSEYFLEEKNKRYWALLKGAHELGVTLYINKPIIEELSTHLKKIQNDYENIYKRDEEIYEDEISSLYIDEIMIRAYFYAKRRKKIHNFSEFINKFVTPNSANNEQELIEWLNYEFGIEYKTNDSLGINIDEKEFNSLYENLKNKKSHEIKAKNDTKTILSIYHLRKKNNEAGKTGVFGFLTWWLSTDFKTYESVKEVFQEKYSVSCYMRPDFLYNYISLAPKTDEVKESFSILFPSLLGINISNHLNDDLMSFIHEKLSDFQTLEDPRRRAIIRNLNEMLKGNPSRRNRSNLETWFDKEKMKYTK